MIGPAGTFAGPKDDTPEPKKALYAIYGVVFRSNEPSMYEVILLRGDVVVASYTTKISADSRTALLGYARETAKTMLRERGQMTGCIFYDTDTARNLRETYFSKEATS